MSCDYSGALLYVEKVTKIFRTYRSPWHRIAGWLGWRVEEPQGHTVLQKITFRIGSGEAVGIVGRNGAGKSTLLKIVAGTVAPTRGTVRMAGRVSAILELGMGFHPDLTGRQNVYHAAGLLGRTLPEIEERLGEIEAFAELGDYFDEPVRIYSSGMQMRLAFSVATAWRPDLLIVDEALSVGDAYFQHKSFHRIRRYREMGTTLLLVSHDRGAIQAVCDRAILLEKGKMIKDGDPTEVMDYYNALIAQADEEGIRQTVDEKGEVRTFSGNGSVRLESLRLLNDDGEDLEVVEVGAPVTLELDVKIEAFLEELVIGYMIKDRLGQTVYGTNTHHLGKKLEKIGAGEVVRFRVRFHMNIGPGSYSLTVAAHKGADHAAGNYMWLDRVSIFEVANLRHPEFVGTAWLPPEEIELTRQKVQTK